jgi:hypothetical protein
MFAKTLALTLVLAGASLSFIGNVSAASVRGGWEQKAIRFLQKGAFQRAIVARSTSTPMSSCASA